MDVLALRSVSSPRGEVETARGRIRSLASSEKAYAPRSGYVDAVQNSGMTVEWRTKIVAWFSEVGAAFSMEAVTVSVATSYLDRYLSRRSCAAVELQLVATACIFLASKLEESRPFRTSDLIALSGGLFCSEDLRLMELDILCVLNWLLNPPTANAAVYQLMVLLAPFAETLDLPRVERKALAYCDLARASYEAIAYPPSLVAVAASVCALRRSGASLAGVTQFLKIVTALDLPYAREDGAAARFHACGSFLLAAEAAAAEAAGNGADGNAMDAEVEGYTDDASSMAEDDLSVYDDDAGERSFENTSPVDVSDVLAYVDDDEPAAQRRRKSM